MAEAQTGGKVLLGATNQLELRPADRLVAGAQRRSRRSYSLLGPVTDDLSSVAAPAEDGTSEGLQDGGAAMAAYARLQFEDLSLAQRQSLRSALLRYCELDTLAMVMALQAWMDWAA